MDAKNETVVKLDLNITKKRTLRRKNSRRYLKRKIRKYYKLIPDHLKNRNGRVNKLCKSVEVEVNMAASNNHNNFEPAITDVSEWSNMHQIAYWKSRAISLEYENRMLYKHIKETHSREIREYANNKPGLTEIQSEFEQKAYIRKKSYKQNQEESEEEKNKYLPPWVLAGEDEKEKYNRLYGSMGSKIRGMEAAAQLNFNHQVENNVPHWPNIPLNL